MKKITVFTLSIMLLLQQIAFATYDEPLWPPEPFSKALLEKVMTFEPSFGGQVHDLSKTLYISPDEIWFVGDNWYQDRFIGEMKAGYFWIQKSNEQGEILLEKTIGHPEGTYLVLLCISKVDNTIMFGAIDGINSTIYIGITDEHNLDFEWIKFDGYAREMTASPDGIAFFGESGDELWYAVLNKTGNIIFEGTEEYSISRGCYSVENGYIFTSYKGNNMPMGTMQELRYLNRDGSAKWKCLLPDTVGIQYITESMGNLFLYGTSGDRDDGSAFLKNLKGMIICLDAETGTEKWKTGFDMPDSLNKGISTNEGCLGFSLRESTYYFCALDYNGEVLQLFDFIALGITIRQIISVENGKLKFVGTDERFDPDYAEIFLGCLTY